MTKEVLTSVTPVRPAAPYQGGKKLLAERLCGILERIPHATYVEPFVGMGGVFLRRRRRPKVEVINDIAGDVATFFRVLQEHYPYFVDMLRWRLASRAEFDRLLAIPGNRLTDLQRAARFLYLQRLAFSGKVAGRSFGVAPTTAGRFNLTKIEPMLADIHERLADVVIEQLPFGELIRRYDGRDTLFYLDPPYLGGEEDYGAGVFSWLDFERIAKQLAAIEGRFVLSINDTPIAREVFGRFEIEAVETSYTIGQAAGMRVSELIVMDGRGGLLGELF